MDAYQLYTDWQDASSPDGREFLIRAYPVGVWGTGFYDISFIWTWFWHRIRRGNWRVRITEKVPFTFRVRRQPGPEWISDELPMEAVPGEMARLRAIIESGQWPKVDGSGG